MRTITNLHPALWLPPSFKASQPSMTAVWPRCFVCKDAVAAYEIVDAGSKRIDVLAKCGHGVKEGNDRDQECLRITWDSDTVTWQDIGERLKTLEFFRPEYNPLESGGADRIGAGTK